MGEISILEIPVGGKFSLSAGLAKSALSVVGCTGAGPTHSTPALCMQETINIGFAFKRAFLNIYMFRGNINIGKLPAFYLLQHITIAI